MPAPTSPSALRAEELVKTYPGGRGGAAVRALDGLNLEVAPGRVVALLGRNGAGKSTAVRILSTLARPDSGRASVAGIDILRDGASADAARRVIGLVAQKPSSDPMATGRENLVLAGRIQGLNRAAAAARAGELLTHFDLVPAADRLAKTYSGGMSRKLDLAIGLVHRPRVLFLDEPSTGLDPEARVQLWAEIARLSGEEELTVLLTTHYLDEADRLADRIAIVDAGRIVVEGTPEELKSELHGDTVHVEVVGPAADARSVLDRVPGVRGASADGTRLRARAESGARAVPAVLAALDAAGVAVASVTVARPSLDDVYLRHVGRSFTEGAA